MILEVSSSPNDSIILLLKCCLQGFWCCGLFLTWGNGLAGQLTIQKYIHRCACHTDLLLVKNLLSYHTRWIMCLYLLLWFLSELVIQAPVSVVLLEVSIHFMMSIVWLSKSNPDKKMNHKKTLLYLPVTVSIEKRSVVSKKMLIFILWLK